MTKRLDDAANHHAGFAGQDPVPGAPTEAAPAGPGDNLTPGLRCVTGTPATLEEALLRDGRRPAGPTGRLAALDVVVGGVLQRPYLQRLIADTSPASSTSASRRSASSAFVSASPR